MTKTVNCPALNKILCKAVPTVSLSTNKIKLASTAFSFKKKKSESQLTSFLMPKQSFYLYNFLRS